MLGAVANIIVLGGGVCGLAAGLMLARDGHDVTLLERDPQPVPATPEEAWERWERDGVAQFRQAHYLHARATHVIKNELPDVRDALFDAGAARLDPVCGLPPGITDTSRRPGDERLATATARRTTIEQVLAVAADEQPRLEVRRGVGVTWLRKSARSGIPHFHGVRTDSGEELEADLIVDAMGRRSTLPKWLAEAGCAPVHEEAEDSGFIYYSRFFRGEQPPEPMAPLLTPIGSFSVLTLPSDSQTWSVTLFTASGDQPLKGLRHPEAFAAAARACPLHAHWLDGEPLTDVIAMGGVIDRYRRFVNGGKPVASGVVAVADAWACTNPSLGRGIALGLAHVARLRDLVREQLDDPLEFAEAWDELTERELTPWYRSTVAGDRARLAEIEALRHGFQPPGPRDFKEGLGPALDVAAGYDPDVFRAMLEIAGCVSLPEEVFARPGMVERVVELAGQHEPVRWPGPSRDELLQLMAEPAGA
jgi:2-polyprenyl-6-methoxyphenol hydroxylase-like FAD-dependent oxidoreductase